MHAHWIQWICKQCNSLSMVTHCFPASSCFPLSASERYSHLLFILLQLTFRGNNTSILLFFRFYFCLRVCSCVNFNNRDSLQIAILPCIFRNPPNTALVMPFKLYSCSKSFSNVSIDHGSQFQPPRVLAKTSRPATVSLRNWFEWNEINADHHFSHSRGSKTLESTKMASLHITSLGYFSPARNKRGGTRMPADSAAAWYEGYYWLLRNLTPTDLIRRFRLI